MTTILITNDDGIHSPGIEALREAVSDLGTDCLTRQVGNFLVSLDKCHGNIFNHIILSNLH